MVIQLFDGDQIRLNPAVEMLVDGRWSSLTCAHIMAAKRPSKTLYSDFVKQNRNTENENDVSKFELKLFFSQERTPFAH